MSTTGILVFLIGLASGGGLVWYLTRSGGDDSGEGASEPTGGEASASAQVSEDSPAAVEPENELGEWLQEEMDARGHSTAPEQGGVERADRSGEEGRSGAGGLAEETSSVSSTTTHWLEGMSGSRSGETFRLRESVSVGRLPRNDLQFDEGAVSRVHCRFRVEQGGVVLEALDTANGTKVNGEEVEPGEPTLLEDEDVVEIGKVFLMYRRNANFEADGLAEASPIMGLTIDAATVNVDTNAWRERIERELDLANGDISAAASVLGMEPEALERLADQLDLGE